MRFEYAVFLVAIYHCEYSAELAQWVDDESIEEIKAIAGDENVTFNEGVLQVRTISGPWITMQPGWWAGKSPGGFIHVVSGLAFTQLYEPGE